MEEAEGGLYLVFEETIVYLYGLQFRRESGVTAVVRPVGIKDTKFCFGGVALLFGKILDYAVEVVGIHCQAPRLAEGCVVRGLHSGEAFYDRGDARPARLYGCGEGGVHIFLTRLYGVNHIVTNARKVGFADWVFEDNEACALDLHIGCWVDEVHTVNCGRGTLVELTWERFDGQAPLPPEGGVCDIGYNRYFVGYFFAEDAVAAFLYEVGRDTEDVIDVEVTEGGETQLEVLIEFVEEGLGFYLKAWSFLYKDTVRIHKLNI